MLYRAMDTGFIIDTVYLEYLTSHLHSFKLVSILLLKTYQGLLASLVEDGVLSVE